MVVRRLQRSVCAINLEWVSANSVQGPKQSSSPDPQPHRERSPCTEFHFNFQDFGAIMAGPTPGPRQQQTAAQAVDPAGPHNAGRASQSQTSKAPLRSSSGPSSTPPPQLPLSPAATMPPPGVPVTQNAAPSNSPEQQAVLPARGPRVACYRRGSVAPQRHAREFRRARRTGNAEEDERAARKILEQILSEMEKSGMLQPGDPALQAVRRHAGPAAGHGGRAAVKPVQSAAPAPPNDEEDREFEKVLADFTEPSWGE